MKYRQGIVWAPVLIIIGAVVVAGFTTFFLIQANQSDNENVNVALANQANSNLSVNTNTNVSTVPTGWKVFTNDYAKYSFQYPTTLIISDCSNKLGSYVLAPGGSCENETFGPGFSVLLHSEPTYNEDETYEEIKKLITNPQTSSVPIDGMLGRRLQGVQKIEDPVFPDQKEKYSDYVFVQARGNFYTIASVSLTSEPFRYTDFENFLATFKFTN